MTAQGEALMIALLRAILQALGDGLHVPIPSFDDLLKEPDAYDPVSEPAPAVSLAASATAATTATIGVAIVSSARPATQAVAPIVKLGS